MRQESIGMQPGSYPTPILEEMVVFTPNSPSLPRQAGYLRGLRTFKMSPKDEEAAWTRWLLKQSGLPLYLRLAVRLWSWTGGGSRHFSLVSLPATQTTCGCARSTYIPTLHPSLWRSLLTLRGRMGN